MVGRAEAFGVVERERAEGRLHCVANIILLNHVLRIQQLQSFTLITWSR